MKTFSCLLLLAGLMMQAIAQPARSITPMAQTEARYRIYDSTGKAVTMAEMLATLDKAEIVCVGELHDDAAAHLFEADLLRGAHERYNSQSAATRRRPLALSLEMFERDVQIVVDEYLKGLVTERHFLNSSRPWNNYQQDYRPLVEFAREQQLAVIASNAPGRYVNRVARLGPQSLKDLTEAAREWLPPLPYKSASPAYADKFKRLMTGPHMTGGAQSPHGTSFLLDAQVLRDATMAHAITQQLKRQPEALVLHVNGSFHSEERLGVPEQIRHYRPQARTIVITITGDKGYPEFDTARLGKLGDFIVLTDPAQSRSF